jgi:hypothetical protein
MAHDGPWRWGNDPGFEKPGHATATAAVISPRLPLAPAACATI